MATPSTQLWRRWLAALVLAAITTPVAIVWIDRPLAEFLGRHAATTRLATVVAIPLALLRPLVFVAFAALLAVGIATTWLTPLTTRGPSGSYLTSGVSS